ncbi:MAG: hypothetical protein FRX48_03673 [Lasallia pustulata]|uniref:MADS-box domain-containing protein n=1 Tax=Lasallia pustulata TaxID=136370 RepID=A0A5M8PVI0_9LECA|nr:MAG: hypothetical protein FRX48_03673 [Lasallia pustulata]
MPDAVKAKTQQFTRRKSNLVKKADRLARLCQADLALIIRKNGRYYTYRSTDHQRWPPTITEINASYPLPVNLLSEDFENVVHKSQHRLEAGDPSNGKSASAELGSSEDT